MGMRKAAPARALIILEVKNQDEAAEKTMIAVRNSRSGKGKKFSNSWELFKDLGIGRLVQRS